jgi:xylulose-5-phosphate/fructose-6-phosphate phosphoketolase
MHAHGYEPHFVEGDDPALVHQRLAATLDKALAHIRRIQADARAPDAKRAAQTPALADDHPGHTQGLDRAEGSGWLPVEGTWRAHQVPIGKFTKPEHLQQLEAWLRSYKPAGTVRRAASSAPSSPRWRRRAGAAWASTRMPTAANCCSRW